VLGQKAHRLAHLRPLAPAHHALEGGHQADADVFRRGQTVQEVHRPHRMHRDDSLLVLEHFSKMCDGAAQRPVAEDVVFINF